MYRNKYISSFMLALAMLLISCNKTINNKTEDVPGEEKYKELINNQLKGWNTYNTRSTLSFVKMPSCFSVNIGFKDYTNKEVLTETIPGFDHEDIFLGAHAYDGSYTCQELNWSGMKYRIESAHVDEGLVILVTPLEVDKVKVPEYFIALHHASGKKHPEFVQRIKPPLIIIEAGMLWNRPGMIQKEGHTLKVDLKNEDFSIYTTGEIIDEYYVGSIKTPYLTVNGFEETGISTSRERPLDEIKEIVQKQKEKHEGKKNKYGKNAEVYDAIQTCLAWNMMYDPQGDRLITPVSRRWNYNNKGYVIYCWDTYFGAYQAAATGNKAVAYANVVEMTREKTVDGFVPNVRKSNGAKTRDRSQPPVGSFCTRDIYKIFGDKWFLELVYDDLKEWNEWWLKKRDYNGLLCYGSNLYEPVNG
ncbi:MAG: MGH1-like glycoside hydrolase domain-containing protein, partial [Bacteroidales bacterium]